MRYLQLIWDKFSEGFIFGFGLYAFFSFGKWMGWF